MKARLFVPALIFLTVTLFKVPHAQEQAGISALSAEITNYYSVCNAVNLYSTPSERRALSINPSLSGPPEKHSSDRLIQIYKLMRWILEQEQEIDPEIVWWGVRSFIKDTPNGVAVVERQNLAGGKLNVYLTNLDHFPLVNEIMAEYFDQPFPARAALGVAALPKGATVEMDAVMLLE